MRAAVHSKTFWEVFILSDVVHDGCGLIRINAADKIMVLLFTGPTP